MARGRRHELDARSLVKAEDLIGKRIFLHGGYATVVSVRPSDGMVVLRYDDFETQTIMQPHLVEELPDERGRNL